MNFQMQSTKNEDEKEEVFFVAAFQQLRKLLASC